MHGDGFPMNLGRESQASVTVIRQQLHRAQALLRSKVITTLSGVQKHAPDINTVLSFPHQPHQAKRAQPNLPLGMLHLLCVCPCASQICQPAAHAKFNPFRTVGCGASSPVAGFVAIHIPTHLISGHKQGSVALSQGPSLDASDLTSTDAARTSFHQDGKAAPATCTAKKFLLQGAPQQTVVLLTKMRNCINGKCVILTRICPT